tara:strand:+ start:102 stop:359 length:258 start_codon:yes stop_codon:yes gene_type:complete
MDLFKELPFELQNYILEIYTENDRKLWKNKINNVNAEIKEINNLYLDLYNEQILDGYDVKDYSFIVFCSNDYDVDGFYFGKWPNI